MGYTTSTIHGIEVPDSSEANNVPEDIGKVVTALEGGSIVKRLTSAAIAALTAPQKPAGLVVYNTTTNKLQISDGTNFSNVVVQQQIQSGITTAIASGGSASITFSPAFASAPTVVAQPTTTVGATGRWAVNPVSTSGCTISQTNGDSYNVAFMWIAVGA